MAFEERYADEMEESEITREALEMIREYGGKALLIAGARATSSVSRQDATKFHYWSRVADTIKDLERRNQMPTP
jgi:hypothetical protein